MKLKRIISIILSLMLIISAVSAVSFAEETAGTTEETADAAEPTEEEAAAGEEAETPAETSEPSEPEVVYGTASLGIVNALGIAEITESQLTESITRAELLKMFCLAAGYSEMKSEEVLFSDLPLDNEYEPYIKALAKLGVIDAGAGGKIFPDGQIGMAEAAAIAVKLTGFGLVAETRGGYPTGYMNVAKSNGILKGLPASQDTVLTKGMAVQLIENMLNADVMVQTGYGSETTFEEEEGNNLLWSVFGVMYLEGVVTGVDISRIAGPNDVTPFHIDIEGFEIEAKDVENPRQYLGYMVNAYYTDDRSDIPKLVWIEKSERNTENIFDAEDVVSIANGRVTVETEDGRDKDFSFNKSVPVIYNGASTAESFSMSLIEDKSGTITLVDNDGDKSADVAILEIFDTFVVSQVDLTNYTIYDEYDSTKKAVLNTTKDNPYVVIYDSEGVETTMSKIGAGSIVCVFSSAPDAYQQYIRAYIVNKTAQGTITRIKNGGETLVIDGNEYELTEQCIKANMQSVPERDENDNIVTDGEGNTVYTEEFALSAGQNVALKFDYSGKVVYIEKLSTGSDLQFGYIIAADLGGGLGGVPKLKIYNMNQNIVIAEIADRVRLDGKAYDGDDASVVEKLETASKIQFPTAAKGCTAQVVKFALDAEGKVSIIDTILNGITGEETTRDSSSTLYDSLFSIAASTSDIYENSNKTLGFKIAMSDDTTCVLYPSPEDGDINDTDLYAVDTVSTLMSDDRSGYTARAFYNDNDEFFASLLGCVNDEKMYEFISSRTSFAVVDEYMQVYNEDTGKIEDALKVYSENGEETVKAYPGFTFTAVDNEAAGLEATMSIDQLKKGDLIRYRTDKLGYIRTLIFYFRIDGNVAVTADSTSTRNSVSVRRGLIYDKFDGGLVVYYTTDDETLNNKDLSGITYDDCEIIVFTGATPVYYSYQEGKNGKMEVSSSNLSELKSYKDTGSDCSRVYMQTYFGVPEGILIY